MADSETQKELEEQQALIRRAKRKMAKQKSTAAREAFVQERTGFADFDELRKSIELFTEHEGSMPSDELVDVEIRALDAPVPMELPVNNLNRWVPIGPSVVKQGQAEGRPRVSGRIRDLEVSQDGLRAYAGTAKGGIWYTSDGGASWEPLGGWIREPRNVGGNTSASSIGCLLVHFDPNDDASKDFVMAGTGEIGAFQSSTSGRVRGAGILASIGPSEKAISDNPFWETSRGISIFEGAEIVRMVRVPGSVPGKNGDQIIVATTGNQNPRRGGLYRGTRTIAGGVGSFNWVQLSLPGLAPLPIPPPPILPPAPGGSLVAQDPTDLVYVNSRLFVCFRSTGVAYSDNHGNSFIGWVTMNLTGVPVGSLLMGRMSIAVNENNANKMVYILGEVDSTPLPLRGNRSPFAHLWQITNPNVVAPAIPTTVALTGMPASPQLWNGGRQRDYDQAINVVTFNPPVVPPAPQRPPVDRVYIGGAIALTARGGTIASQRSWNASIWAFDVSAGMLNPSAGVSDQPNGTNHGADLPGLIGNAVHPDVHVIRKATTQGTTTRQIWVGCDGGVFVSNKNGQTNTFASRNVGLASIEAGFIASHPTSSHFAMLGCQDNGRQVRVGDTVWELKTSMQGDGGGVIFHPVRSHYVLGQFNSGIWACDPSSRYIPPIVVAPAQDAENRGSAFYSGISAIAAPTLTNPSRVRIALGTNRVWLTDNLGTANPNNTWNVLPISPGGPTAASDPRPGWRTPSTAANRLIGVPIPPGAITNVTSTGTLGTVITVKWANSTTLLALYRFGIVRYTETIPPAVLGWTSTILLSPGMAPPVVPPGLVIPNSTFLTDIEPVPGTNNFYVTCTGQTNQWIQARPATPTSPAIPITRPTADTDTCFYFDNAVNGFRRTGLGQMLPKVPPSLTSPIDPAYSVVIDPANSNNVFVGTATTIWLSNRGPGPNFRHTPWMQFDNGLPESIIQDLKIWTGAPGVRLLRAALQSRGVWEVNLAIPEPARTYIRAHDFDDRRIFPTPLKNPRRRPTAPNVSVIRSPDITIRPQTPVENTPSFRANITINRPLKYQLWTFQTAFRWIFPSVTPDGIWTDQFGDLVERHRISLGLSNSRIIDEALWTSVMATTLDENNNIGVYRAPWQNALSSTSPATEIDLMETVVPRRDRNTLWQVYREKSIVDVLLHHRDTRPVPANGAVVILLWRAHRNRANLMATDCSTIVAYTRSLFNGPALPTPPGWNVQLTNEDSPMHRLSVPLSTRMPRAVPINLDLSSTPSGNRVLLLALSGSTLDQFSATPTVPVNTVTRLVRNWPHAACRLISVWNRPGTKLFNPVIDGGTE